MSLKVDNIIVQMLQLTEEERVELEERLKEITK